MIDLKSPTDFQKMREAGKLLALAMGEADRLIRPGISTEEIDHAIRDYVKGRGGTLLFYKYKGFPASTCISINEEVVHGIPSPRRRLRDGDIVSIDVGVKLHGYCADAARTFPVGAVGEEGRRLIEVCREALARGIRASVAGGRVSDISRAIQGYVEAQRFSVVREYVGHGIGKKMHEKPQIPNYVEPGFLKTDTVLLPGMALAIEPMVNAGTWEVKKLRDDWTVVTKDGKLSAHFEHSVGVTEDGPLVLTEL